MAQKYDPIETLMKEHREYEAKLGELRAHLAPGPDAETSRFRARKVAEFGGFFEREVEGIHGKKEETALFPALSRYLPAPGPVEVMVMDHREMRASEETMRKSATQIESDPGAGEVRAEMLSSASNLVSLLLHHIQKEDNILFPTARNVLLPKEMEEVARACQEIEREREGAKSR